MGKGGKGCSMMVELNVGNLRVYNTVVILHRMIDE